MTKLSLSFNMTLNIIQGINTEVSEGSCDHISQDPVASTVRLHTYREQIPLC